MWVLRIFCGGTWRCINLSNVVTLHVSVDGPCVRVSIVVPSGDSTFPVALRPVKLE